MRVIIALFALALSGCVSDGPQGGSSNKPDYAEASRLNTELGSDYLRKGQTQQAKEKLLRAVQQDSRNAQAHSSLAVAYVQLGETSEAKRHYKKALSLNGDDPSLKNNYGTFLCSQGEYEAAEKLFLEAARDRKYSTPEAALTNAGICLRQGPARVRAEPYFREAIQINPQFAEALAQLAVVSFEQDDFLRARAFIQRFERVGKHNAETLTLAAKTEIALGDRTSAAQYQRRLKKEFPDAPQPLKTFNNSKP